MAKPFYSLDPKKKKKKSDLDFCVRGAPVTGGWDRVSAIGTTLEGGAERREINYGEAGAQNLSDEDIIISLRSLVSGGV